MHLRITRVAAIAVTLLAGACSDDVATSADQCATGRTSNQDEGERMEPGGTCITCHEQEGEGPSYRLAGTVMAASDDPQRCAGVGAVTVRITGADGSVVDLLTNDVGNFFHAGSVATPYTAKVIRDGAERVMATPQIEGDCNSCHTPEGASGAPGRILAP